MDFNRKIMSFLKKNQMQKKKTIFTVFLSVLMVLCVVSSLIMPAVSMTIDAIQSNLLMTDDPNLMGAAPDDAPDALDITSGTFYATASVDGNIIYNTYPNGSTDDYIITGNQAEIQFDLEYTMSDAVDQLPAVGPHLYMQIDRLLTDSDAFQLGSANGNVLDGDYDLMIPAGDFQIEDGYIKITLTSAYIDYLKTQGGNLKGTLSFSGAVNRSDTEDGDRNLSFNGQEITVQFEDQYPEISQKSGQIDDNDGTIDWTVTINNSYGIDLSSYTFSDTMLGDIDVSLADNTSIQVNPPAAAQVTGKNIVFTSDSKNAPTITITYTTKMTEDQLSANGNVTNTAKITKGEIESSKTGSVWLSNPFGLNKSGQPNYDTKKIDWTITIDSYYGVSLDGYCIEDVNIPSNAAFTISPEGASLTLDNGKWRLSGTGSAKQVKIQYATDVTDTNNTTTQNNTVKLEYPSGSPTGNEETADATYKKESDLINFTKSAENYHPDAHEITWSITVTPERLVNENQYYSLKDYTLTDGAFAGLTLNDLTFEPSWLNLNDGQKVTLENGTLTFHSDVRQIVTIRYNTKVDFGTSTDAVTVTNSIEDSNNHTTTVSTAVTPRNSFSKKLNSSSTKTEANSGQLSETLNWQAEILWDGDFANLFMEDTPGVTVNVTSGVNASHTLKEGTIQVYAKKGQYDAEIPIDSSNYIVTSNQSSFNIQFKENNILDTEGYNYVRITYDTTVTMDSVLGNENAFANGSIVYTFSNKGSFNGVTDDGTDGNNTYTFTRTNPEMNEKADIVVTKQWNDQNNAAGSRPDHVKLKIEYKKKVGDKWDVNWHYVRGSENQYLFFDETSGADNTAYNTASDFVYELNAENNWMMNFVDLGLPKRESKANADGTQGTITEYCYRVTEVEAGGITISNNFFRVSNGSYEVTYQANDGASAYNDGISSGNMKVFNTFRKNIDIQAKKTWEGNGEKYPVTVKLQRKCDEIHDWHDYTPDNGVGTVVLNEDNHYTYDGWTNLPAMDVETNAQGSKLHVHCRYRIVEVSFDGTEVTEDHQIILMYDDASDVIGYYEVTQRESNAAGSDSNNNLPTQLLEVKNTFYKTEDITITAKKTWSDNNYKLNGVIVQLQRKAEGAEPADWAAYPDAETSEKTLNEANRWMDSWSNLPNQKIDADGSVTKYTYRLVEIGVVTDNDTVIFSDKVHNQKKFTVTEDGYYEINYSINSLNTNGTVTITNTFKKAGTTSITPEKKWEGDSAYASQRPNVTLELQQQVGDGEWQPLKGTVQGGQFVADENESVYRITLDSNHTEITDVNVWVGTTISGLPSRFISVNDPNDGTYTEQICTYRFVEVVTVDGTEQKLESGDSFSVTYGDIDGKYTVTINGGIVSNTFEENIGIDKSIVDFNGNPISVIDKDDLENYKKTIDGKEYYVFNWIVEYDGNKSDLITPISDQLPEGFTLCTDSDWEGKQLYWKTPSDTDATSAITGKGLTAPDYKEGRIFDGYYEQPGMVWPGYGFNCARVTDSFQSVLDHWDSGEWYYYDTASNKVYFNKPSMWAMMAVCYATKIECDVLDAKVAIGTYTIRNYVVKLNKDGTETDKTDVASLTIENNQSRGFITKNYSETLIPGYIQYSLDINPQGKNLSNGETVDIEDLFKTNSYYDHDWDTSSQVTEQTEYGDKLVDILMNSIQVYQYDANGNETLLPANAYTCIFRNGDDVENGAALLKLTVPDEAHLRIVYSYKIIANENTPSVLNGCKSSTRENGRFVEMRPGLVPPEGDIIVFSNTANLTSDSASDISSQDNISYEVFKASGTISTSTLPKVTKVNTGDFTIDDLSATFLLAKYENGLWYYVTNVDDKGTLTWSTVGLEGTKIPGFVRVGTEDRGVEDNAFRITTPNSAVFLNLEENVLYKLVEISPPSDYEGSNLTSVDGNTLGKEYETLLRGYLNEGIYNRGGLNYKIFLDSHVHTHYLAYNSVLQSSDYPEGITASQVMQIKSGGDIQIPNNELIDITVNKNWIGTDGTVEEDKAGSVTVKLYWSYTKASTGIPEDAKLAEAAELGILNSNFTNTKTITTPMTLPAEPTWKDLPNGKNDQPIYYYVKETAYTIGDTTYTLNDEGQYVSGGENGSYLPTYVGNATYVSTTDSNGSAQNNAIVTINNSQQLFLKKEWKDASGNPLSNRRIPTSFLVISIYGINADNQKTTKPLFTTRLTAANNWQANITQLVDDIDLSQYTSFEAQESGGTNLDKFVVSCVFNLNQNTGEITITNRNTEVTEASVTVNKVWSDGAELHKNDKITVTLYQSNAQVPDRLLTNLTADILENNYSAKVMQPVDADDTQNYEDVVLNTANGWKYTWTNLPLDNATDDADATESYYYYVIESSKTVTENGNDISNKYTASYTATSNGTKTEYQITNTRNAIVLQKQWYDENGAVIVQYDENGNLVDEDGNLLADDSTLYDNLDATVEVYQQTTQVPTGEMGIVAFGDSITNGYWTSTEDYPTKLTAMLKEAEYQLKNDHVENQGISQQQIGGSTSEGFRSRVSNIPSDTDIVLFLGGTNDIHQGGSAVHGNPQGVFERFQACIEEIQAQTNNQAVIFVGSIPHFDFFDDNGSPTEVTSQSWWSWMPNYNTAAGEATANDYIDQYNALIKQYADSSTSDNVYFVDICKAVDKDTMLRDGCHPNAVGYTAIANAYYQAIADYYTVDDANSFQANVTLNKSNNWTAAIDVPDDGTYYVREIAPTSGWKVTYSDPATVDAPSATPIGQTAGGKILIKNTSYTPKTQLSVEKTWSGDTITDRPDNISLVLLRRVNEHDAWEEYVAEPTVEKDDANNKWMFTYTNLPAKDLNGDAYYYKVEEDSLDGYTPSYGTAVDQEENGLIAVVDGDSGKLHITNNRTIALKLKKEWSDMDENSHVADSVTVKLYRSTDLGNVPASNLQLAVSPATVSIGVGKTAIVTANKTITGATLTSLNSSIATASLDEDGNIMITGHQAGSTTITVECTDEDGVAETAAITVNVSSLEIFLNNTTDFSIAAGTEGTLSAKLNDVVRDDATFVVLSGNATITGDKIVANTVEPVIVKATVVDDGVTHETQQEIAVTYPEFRVSDVTIVQGMTMYIAPDNYGGFTYTVSPANSAITVSADGTLSAENAAAGDSAEITVSREGNTSKTFEVNVIDASIKVTPNSAYSYQFEQSFSNISKIKIVLENIENITNQWYYGLDITLCTQSGNIYWEAEKLVSLQNFSYDPNGTITYEFDTNDWDVSKSYTELYFTSYSMDYSVKFIDVTYTDSTLSASTFSLYTEEPQIVGKNSMERDVDFIQDGENSGVEVAAIAIGQVPNTGTEEWTHIVRDLPVYDENGNPYYYWAVEESVTSGYKAFYTFEDGDETIDNAINAENLGDGTITIRNVKTQETSYILPSTGGGGRRIFTITGIVLMGSAAAAYILIKRRQKKSYEIKK